MRFTEGKKNIKLFTEIFKTLGWALSVLKDFRFRLYLYMVCLVLQAVYQLYMTSKVGNIVDMALEDNIDKLWSTGLFFVFLFFVNILITTVCNRFAAVNYNGIYNELELKVYRKIMDASWEGLTDYHSGDLITRLSSDIKTVAGNTSGLVPTMISKISLILGAGVLIVYLDCSMIILAALIGPIVVVASRIFMGKIYRYEMKIREMESLIASYNVETFNNIQAVKAFGLGDDFYDTMNGIEIERKKIDLKTNKYIVSSYAASYTAGILGACILIGWMFYRVHSGNISFGSLSVIAFLALQMGQATESFLDLVPTIMAYMASADRIRVLLSIPDEKDRITADEVDRFIAEGESCGISIHVKDMFFKYKNNYSVFEGASIDAAPGEIIALVGPSGEGKTTMLRVLLGIVTPYKGKAYASNGKRTLDLGMKTRSIISYVPQGNTMMTGSILDNMRMANKKATEAEVKKALKTAGIMDFIETLPEGLSHKIGQNGQGFSEGQNQRISIARALLKNAPVLLMDEATSALDVATERKILDAIRRENPKKTIIITTHRPTVLAMCDKVYRIADKKISIIGQNDIQKLMDEF